MCGSRMLYIDMCSERGTEVKVRNAPTYQTMRLCFVVTFKTLATLCKCIYRCLLRTASDYLNRIASGLAMPRLRTTRYRTAVCNSNIPASFAEHTLTHLRRGLLRRVRSDWVYPRKRRVLISARAICARKAYRSVTYRGLCRDFPILWSALRF